ncbi:MAG TPA: hypothetical protein VFT75_02930 [Nocardioidaceae bacterium]|nr:hypothetical protein [Nocardioidaceae bacterium]
MAGSFAKLDDDGRQTVLDALYALEHSAGYLSAVDVSNAEANLAEPKYRPLTKTCIEAATKLRAQVEEVWGLPSGLHVGEVPGEVVPLSR